MDLISREQALGFLNDLFGEMQTVTFNDVLQSFEKLPSVFDGKTNGEVVEAVWGYSIGTNNDVLTVQTDINAVLVIIDIEGMRRELRFNLDWWNAPYKGVSK